MNSYHNVFNAMAGQGYTNVQISHDKGPFADCVHRSVSFPAPTRMWCRPAAPG